MRNCIGGQLDLPALCRLARPELEHRPTDSAALGREARRLAAQGLAPRDIGEALRLAPAAVSALLATDGPNWTAGGGSASSP